MQTHTWGEMINYYRNIQILCEWRKPTNANIFHHMFLCIVTVHHTHRWETPVNLFSTLLISSELFMWNDTQSQMSPSGHRTAAGSVFTHVCSFTSFFPQLWLMYFCSLAALTSRKLTFIMTNSHPQKISQTDCSGIIFIDRKDRSSRPLLISDVTVSLTFDLITCTHYQHL